MHARGAREQLTEQKVMAKTFHFNCHIAVVDKTGNVIAGQWNTRTVLHAVLGETEVLWARRGIPERADTLLKRPHVICRRNTGLD